MIFRRLLLGLMAAFALACCGAGILGALLMAAFLALRSWLGPAGAAGLLSAGLATALALAALFAARDLLSHEPKRPRTTRAAGASLTGALEARPILSLILAVVAGVAAAVNPNLLKAAARFFLRTPAATRSG